MVSPVAAADNRAVDSTLVQAATAESELPDEREEREAGKALRRF